MTALSTGKRLRDALAEHFVMWHALDGIGPLGEWRCACGEKFGFSDSAIDHQADALAGAVVNVATLADDGALVERAARAANAHVTPTGGYCDPAPDDVEYVAAALRALATALTERTS